MLMRVLIIVLVTASTLLAVQSALAPAAELKPLEEGWGAGGASSPSRGTRARGMAGRSSRDT